MPPEPDESKPIGWVIGMLALLVAYGGWAFLAMDYYRNDPDDGFGRRSFWMNSVIQLANLPGVISFACSYRTWFIILIALLEILVIVLWIVMKKLERELQSK
jgi:hypothetical protein